MTHVDEDAANFKAGTDFLREIHYRRAVEAKAVYHAFWDLGFVDARPMMGIISGVRCTLLSALARARANAAHEGRTLPEITEQNDFFNSDIIIADMGGPDERDEADPSERYALFEVSVTADCTDVTRARDRSECLAQTLGVPVVAAVITAAAPDTLGQEADAAGAKVFISPES